MKNVSDRVFLTKKHINSLSHSALMCYTHVLVIREEYNKLNDDQRVINKQVSKEKQIKIDIFPMAR